MAKGAKPIVVEFDRMLKLLDLPQFDDEFYRSDMSEAYHWAYKQAIEDELSESEAEQKGLEAESDEQDEYFKIYMNALESVIESAFSNVGLVVEHRKKDGSWLLTPEKSWEDAARKIVEVINGVGYFHFNTLREFFDSGPYTAREAVENHVGYAKDYYEVYGDRSPRSRFDSRVR